MRESQGSNVTNPIVDPDRPYKQDNIGPEGNLVQNVAKDLKTELNYTILDRSVE